MGSVFTKEIPKDKCKNKEEGDKYKRRKKAGKEGREEEKSEKNHKNDWKSHKKSNDYQKSL